MDARRKPTRITEQFIESACARLRDGAPLRRSLPGWGRVHIDRQLPFLVVYRRPEDREDPETDRLVTGEASYLLASSAREHRPGVTALVRAVVDTFAPSFGAFLLFEIWADPDGPDESGDQGPYSPHFRVLRARGHRLSSTVQTLSRALGEIRIKGDLARVEVVPAARVAPPGLPPLPLRAASGEAPCSILGIAVRPVYRAAEAGQSLPLVRRALHRGLSRALKRAAFEFTRRETTHRPPHYHALGRRSVVKAVWDVDRELASVSGSFDFLLQVTPVNSAQAWREFRRNRFQTEPVFVSRPLPVDPSLLKRRLYAIPVERIEDPTLDMLFRLQQIEIDRKLTLLGDRGRPEFRYGSLQLYGGVDDGLLSLSYELLNRLPRRTRDDSTRNALGAEEFAERARAEIDHYRRIDPGVTATVEIREDVTGLMVSRGNLLVGREARIPLSRVEALLSHEIGTHVLTYFNARAQPFRQLHVGLAGYEELQEGLAVTAEYLAGGLSRPRLRLLAARVVAVRRMLDGASFPEVFEELRQAYGFDQSTSFTVAMRVFRSGGLTKDAVYLRGLTVLLDYLKQGGDLDILFVGKIARSHIEIIRELQWRGVLREPSLRPRWLELPGAPERVIRLRNGVNVFDLIDRRRK